MKKTIALVLATLFIGLLVPCCSFADPYMEDPGSQEGSADILVGEGNFLVEYARITGISDSMDLSLVNVPVPPDDVNLEFNFNDNNVTGIDGMFVRTLEETGSITGSFDIFNIDSVDITYDDVIGSGMYASPDVSGLVSGDQVFEIGWDFKQLAEGRRETYFLLDSDPKDGYSGSGETIAVGVIKVDSDPEFTVVVYKVENEDALKEYFDLYDDTMPLEVNQYEVPEVLYSARVESLDVTLPTFVLEQDSDGLLVIALQNWWKNEIVLTEQPYLNFVGEDLIVTSGEPYGAELELNNPEQIGSGTSVFINAGTIADLGGLFTVPFANEKEMTFQWDGEDIDVENSSGSGGCNVGVLGSFAGLLLLPLLFLIRK